MFFGRGIRSLNEFVRIQDHDRFRKIKNRRGVSRQRKGLPRAALFLPTHRSKLIQRKRVAHFVQWLMTRQTLGLIHTGAVLHGGRERSVVPFFITQHVGDLLASACIARHRRVEKQLVGHEKAVAAGDRLRVGIELGRVHFSEQHHAVA